MKFLTQENIRVFKQQYHSAIFIYNIPTYTYNNLDELKYIVRREFVDNDFNVSYCATINEIIDYKLLEFIKNYDYGESENDPCEIVLCTHTFNNTKLLELIKNNVGDYRSFFRRFQHIDYIVRPTKDRFPETFTRMELLRKSKKIPTKSGVSILDYIIEKFPETYRLMCLKTQFGDVRIESPDENDCILSMSEKYLSKKNLPILTKELTNKTIKELPSAIIDELTIKVQ